MSSCVVIEFSLEALNSLTANINTICLTHLMTLAKVSSIIWLSISWWRSWMSHSMQASNSTNFNQILHPYPPTVISGCSSRSSLCHHFLRLWRYTWPPVVWRSQLMILYLYLVDTHCSRHALGSTLVKRHDSRRNDSNSNFCRYKTGELMMILRAQSTMPVKSVCLSIMGN